MIKTNDLTKKDGEMYAIRSIDLDPLQTDIPEEERRPFRHHMRRNLFRTDERIMNGAFFQANYDYTHEFFDGWVGTGLWDDDNRTMQRLCADFTAAHPELGHVPPEILGLYRDGMVALLEGIAAAPILTPRGVREGLENVRMVPAAIGGDRTVLSFGPFDHKGHKGMDNMVIRRLTKGKLVMEGRFEPFGSGRAPRPVSAVA